MVVGQMQALCFSGEVCIGVAYYHDTYCEGGGMKRTFQAAAGDITGDIMSLTDHGIFLGLCGKLGECE